jgi:hypothetical protein
MGRMGRMGNEGTTMQDVETGRFTVGVFQDTSWAERGIDALKSAGFAVESLTILAKESPGISSLVEHALGGEGQRIELPGLGAIVVRGPLLAALESPELRKMGLGAAMHRAGFQQHDGRIFETLTARGGVLVAIRSEPAAADALALLHSYGGGNAAIGAWSGRV